MDEIIYEGGLGGRKENWFRMRSIRNLLAHTKHVSRHEAEQFWPMVCVGGGGSTEKASTEKAWEAREGTRLLGLMLRNA